MMNLPTKWEYNPLFEDRLAKFAKKMPYFWNPSLYPTVGMTLVAVLNDKKLIHLCICVFEVFLQKKINSVNIRILRNYVMIFDGN